MAKFDLDLSQYRIAQPDPSYVPPPACNVDCIQQWLDVGAACAVILLCLAATWAIVGMARRAARRED